MSGLTRTRELFTLSDRLRAAAAKLAAVGIDAPRREARLLLVHASGLDVASLLREVNASVEAPGFEALIDRRAAREPLAFITGHQPFWTLDLLVSPVTLIPRADSETLIEAALAAFAGREVRRILDLGAGTGCLLLAALTEFPQAFGIGVDRAAGAAALARQNAERTGLASRAAFVCGDWAAPLQGRFDLVLSNPPYIEHAVIPGLMPEVAVHEPALALDGGSDGLDCYRVILAALPALLAPSGVAILEIGRGQADAVAAIARANGLAPDVPMADLAGIPRALAVRL